MSNNPKLATEKQVQDVSNTFAELFNHQGKQIKALESGVIDAIEPSSPAPTKRGEYKVTKVGVYINFKDANGQPISVTEEDYSSGNVSIIFNGTDNRKLVVPITFEGEIKEGDTRGVSGETIYFSRFKDDSGVKQIIDAVSNGTTNIDKNIHPKIIDDTYINREGHRVTTKGYRSTDYVDLLDCESILYTGFFGEFDTSIAFYDNDFKFIESFPSKNHIIKNIEIFRKENFQKVRFSIKNNIEFEIILKNVKSQFHVTTKLQNFRFIGTPIYENNNIKKSNIIWNDGSKGVVVYNDWNDKELTFESYIATSNQENGVFNIEQPRVTFNDDGLIIDYPNLIISK